MKKLFHLLLLSITVLILTLTACTQNKEPITPTGKTVTLALSTPTTRTSLIDDSYVRWTNTDFVWINSGSFMIEVSQEDPSQATVSDVPASSSYIAFFSPKAGTSTENGTTYHFIELPQNQPYTKESFAPQANPMVAYSTSTNLAFKNLCGVIRLSITGTQTLSKITLSGNNDEAMAGLLTLTPENLINGVVDATISTRHPHQKNIIMEAPSGLTLNTTTPKEVYIVLPAQTYSQGVTVTLSTTDGKTSVQKSNSPITIERSKIKDMEPFAFTESTKIQINAGEITPTSITYTVSAKASSNIRTLIISKDMWDHYINGSYASKPDALPGDILTILGETIITDNAGNYLVLATNALKLNETGAILAATDYKILASYADAQSSIGEVIIRDIRSANPTGVAPSLTLTSKPVTERAYTNAKFTITTANASVISTVYFAKASYEKHTNSGLTDIEILHKFGFDLNSEAVSIANSGGTEHLLGRLTSNSEYVLLVLAAGSGGMEATTKLHFTTPHYVDPAANWTTVSTNATFTCGFFQLFNISPFDIKRLTVDRMNGTDFFRLTNAFPVSIISSFLPGTGISAATDGPFHLYIDATDHAAVKIEPYENRLGLVSQDIGDISVGSGPFVLDPETLGEYTFGTYDDRTGVINIQPLLRGAAYGLFYMTTACTLTLNAEETPSGNVLSTENFQKDSILTPW